MLSYELIRQRLAIDVNALDDECAHQGELFLEAGELFSQAKADSEAARYNLDAIAAKVELKIRAGEIKTDIKITETSILALVASNAEVIAAKKTLVAARKLAGDCGSLVDAFDHRRSMLSNEVSLYTTSYFQTGSIKSRQTNSQELEQRIIEERKKQDARRKREGEGDSA